MKMTKWYIAPLSEWWAAWPEVKVVRVFTTVSCVLSVIGLCLWLNAFV